MAGFFIQSSSSMAVLAEALADGLRRSPLPPLTQEVIVVQSQGMRRWVTLKLADHLGVAGSLHMPFPGGFCHHLAERLAPADQLPVGPVSAFDREAMTFRIMEILTHYGNDPRFQGVNAYLSKGSVGKRYQLCARLANLFDDYMIYRPEMLAAWEAGEKGGREDGSDWQSELWCRLCLGTDEEHLAKRFLRLTAALEESNSAPAGLPDRICVFGVSTLPPVFLRLLLALSRFIPVTLYRFNAGENKNAFAAQLGRQGREFEALLASMGEERLRVTPPQLILPERDSLLHHLQADILTGVDRSSRGLEDEHHPISVDAADDSLLIHDCHSMMREMEVLRDTILNSLKGDTDLTPGDILVMVPDITAYAPYIQTVFGVTHEGLPYLPHRIADQQVSGENPLIEAVLSLLRLSGARLTSLEVTDLLKAASVREAARLTEDELGTILGWVEALNIRWGESGAQRAEAWDLPEFSANTWESGIDRLLMGYATGEVDHLVAGIYPEGDGGVGRADLIGRFSTWLKRLFFHLGQLRQDRPLAAWGESILALVGALVEAGDEDDIRALQLVRDTLLRLSDLQALSGFKETVTRSEVVNHLTTAFQADGFGHGFISGAITFCALKPMRTLPFQMIAVCGLSNGAFPRSTTPPAFDLQAHSPRLGDRSVRNDDRQLFLETMLSAGNRLHLSYVGRSAKDNGELAPSICLSELFDTLARSFRAPEEGALLDMIRVRHHLQPFCSAYYDGSNHRLFSYSRENCRAGTVAVNLREELVPFLPAPLLLEDDEGRSLDLYDLIDCWMNPSRYFLKSTLKLRADYSADELEEREPIEMDGLSTYGVRSWLVQRRLETGRHDTEEEAALVASKGMMPPAGVGAGALAQITTEVGDFLERMGQPVFCEPLPLWIESDGFALSGMIDQLTTAGERLQFRPTRLKARDRISAWVTHVALNALAEETGLDLPRVTRLVGLDGEERFGPVDAPLRILKQLIEGFYLTLRRPVPFFGETSYAFTNYAHQQKTNKRLTSDPLVKARVIWYGGSFSKAPPECEEEAVALAFRGRDPLADSAESFKEWADRFWQPYLVALSGGEE